MLFKNIAEIYISTFILNHFNLLPLTWHVLCKRILFSIKILLKIFVYSKTYMYFLIVFYHRITYERNSISTCTFLIIIQNSNFYTICVHDTRWEFLCKFYKEIAKRLLVAIKQSTISYRLLHALTVFILSDVSLVILFFVEKFWD